MKEFWNERYRAYGSAYGQEPNAYFKQQLLQLEPGSILLPAEGEGRNAVYAANLGWDVTAFDLSEQGKLNAEKLAKKNHVEIHYTLGEFSEIQFNKATFDCIGLIYAHFSSNKKSDYHRVLDSYLKKGGVVILEGFGKKNLELNARGINANGPKDEGMLFSIENIKSDFPNYEIMELKEEIFDLNEGLYHKGKSALVRFVGMKK